MRIKSVRIENFRGFVDETVHLNDYTCIVGPNGAGKSTVLAALNVFFKERAPFASDVTRLTADDCFKRDTSKPIQITLVLHDLGAVAAVQLSDYVRSGELIVTFEATIDATKGICQSRYFGQRLGFASFRPYFDALKRKAKAPELNTIYDALRASEPGLPDAPRSIDAKAEALRAFESANPDQCTPLASEDDFYGIGGAGKLNPFIQWVYVPAVKDANAESLETKGTVFAKLIARAARSRTTFEARLAELKTELDTKYQQILEDNAGALADLKASLQGRLCSWAHPDVKLAIDWAAEPRSVVVDAPSASIKTGEGDFLGEVTRMGHGLQRSFLLAILQELAQIDGATAPTLVLGCEEPELYQHPPQARHLAATMEQLTTQGCQILVTTHSPLFVNGEGFENVRLLRRERGSGAATASGTTLARVVERLRQIRGDETRRRIDGVKAKIHQFLQPSIAEMFFARIPVLVEGLEDVAYIASHLHLSDQWEEFRKLGCHLVPVGGKDKLVQAVTIASEMKMPCFLIFDADGHATRPDQRIKHEKDNVALSRLLGIREVAFPPTNVVGVDHVIWRDEIGPAVEADFAQADYRRLKDEARQDYAHEADLDKNALYIADWLTLAKAEGRESGVLVSLCDAVIAFARAH
jgi:putative ATP-dependent endonuclease of OLD family